MERDRPNFFAGPYIDRRAEERENPHWRAEARADPATRYLLAQGTAQLLQSGAEPHIALLDNSSALLTAAEPDSEVLLGWFHGARSPSLTSTMIAGSMRGKYSCAQA